VTLIAPDAEKLRELDDHTRRAWSAYSERLRGLSTEDYESAEDDSWDALQVELRSVEHRRRVLNQTGR